MSEFVSLFVVNVVTFVAFYFSVPHSAGMTMEELSSSGIWRRFYQILTGVGWMIYIFTESLTLGLSNSLSQNILKRPLKYKSRLYVATNLLVYVLLLVALNSLYAWTNNIIIGVEEVEAVKLGSGDLTDTYYNTLSYLQIVKSYMTNEEYSLHLRLVSSIKGVILLLLNSVVYFATIYGILSNKLAAINIVDKICKIFGREEIGEEPQSEKICTKIVHSLLSFINDIAFPRHWRFISVIILSMLGIMGYSIVGVFLKEDASLLDLLWEVLLESGVIGTLSSFILSGILLKILELLGRKLYKRLPESTQIKLSEFSSKCKDKYNVIKAKREEWSANNDKLYQWSTFDKHKGGLKEMHLD